MKSAEQQAFSGKLQSSRDGCSRTPSSVTLGLDVPGPGQVMPLEGRAE